MPEMDGLEASRRITAKWPSGERPRIVAMTANAMDGDREMCLAAGMDDYITKPIRVDQLVEALIAGAGTQGRLTMTDTVIDLAVFRELQETAGADFVTELVDTFLEEAPAMLAELRARERMPPMPSNSAAPRIRSSRTATPSAPRRSGRWRAKSSSGDWTPTRRATRRRSPTSRQRTSALRRR